MRTVDEHIAFEGSPLIDYICVDNQRFLHRAKLTKVAAITSFEQFKLNRQLLNALQDAGFEQPTEIQQKAIPLIMGGQEVIGIAQTGTGKTAAYLLPILMKVKFATGVEPRALILAPTKELT